MDRPVTKRTVKPKESKHYTPVEFDDFWKEIMLHHEVRMIVRPATDPNKDFTSLKGLLKSLSKTHVNNIVREMLSKSYVKLEDQADTPVKSEETEE